MHTKIKNNVYWVGVVDWDKRNFHGHELSVHRGTTYNAYLILGEKNILIDSVTEGFSDQFIENIKELIDPSKIDIVVLNHAEPDHSGGIPAIMEYIPDAEVIVSRKGKESIPGHFHKDWNFKVVKTGDAIDVGKNQKLVFIEAPMLHWPDSMFSYLTGDNILFSNDAFGEHYASDYRFNDEVDQNELAYETLKYYANILTPFSSLVTRKIMELKDMNVPVDIIAPSHGIIWRKNPMQIVEKYAEWAEQKPEDYVLILYDTMWDSTKRMAEAIAEGVSATGIKYKVLNLSVTDRNDTLVEVFKASTLVIGSPTLNNGLLPTVSPILIDLKGLKFKNKHGAAFGSYGWSGEAVSEIEKMFADCKIPLIPGSINIKWRPTKDDLDRCKQFGLKIAKYTLKEMVSAID
jgi:flavorubredoxin